MINKNQYNVQNTKKVLHKVGKHWLIVSAIVLGLLTGGATVAGSTVVNANASSVPTTQNVQPSANKSNNTSNANSSSATSQSSNSTASYSMPTMYTPVSNPFVHSSLIKTPVVPTFHFNTPSQTSNVASATSTSQNNIVASSPLIPNRYIPTMSHGTNQININHHNHNHNRHISARVANHRASVDKANVTKNEVNSVTTSNLKSKAKDIKALKKSIKKYRYALRVQHKANMSANRTKAIKNADNKVHQAENMLHHVHGKRAMASAQNSLKRAERNYLAVIKGTVKSNNHKSYNNANAMKRAKENIVKAQRRMRHAHTNRAKLSARKSLIRVIQHYNGLVKQYNANVLKLAKHNLTNSKVALRHAHGWRAKKNARKSLHNAQATYKRLSHEVKQATNRGKHHIRRHNIRHHNHFRRNVRHSKRGTHKSSHKRNK